MAGSMGLGYEYNKWQENENRRLRNEKRQQKNKENANRNKKKKIEAARSYLKHLECNNKIINKVLTSDKFKRDILPGIKPRSSIATALGHSSLKRNTTETTSRKNLENLVETLKSNASTTVVSGGSKKKKKTTKKKVKKQYKTVKGVGKRLVRKYKSGGKYVMVGGKKMRI